MHGLYLLSVAIYMVNDSIVRLSVDLVIHLLPLLHDSWFSLHIYIYIVIYTVMYIKFLILNNRFQHSLHTLSHTNCK